MHIAESSLKESIFPVGKLPLSPKGLRWVLGLLKIPGIRYLGVRAVMQYLPRCENVEMSPGFKMFYGNIVAKNVSFCDVFFQDYADIVIGEGTSFSYQCMVLTASHDFEADFQTVIAKPIIIGKNVWISSRVIILGGARIGDGSVIAAGSVVAGEIPAGVLACGVPARPIRKISRPS